MSVDAVSVDGAALLNLPALLLVTLLGAAALSYVFRRIESITAFAAALLTGGLAGEVLASA